MPKSSSRKSAQWDLSHEYSALMDQCGAGVIVLDALGVIQRANQTASRLFGVPEHSVIGMPLTPPIFTEDLCELVEKSRSLLATQRLQISLPEPGGSVLMVSVSPIFGERRKHSRFIVIAQDVTELRRLETVRRDFVANVSHELRTPLASIRAMAETLQDGALQDETVNVHFLGTIITETERLARISEDLLILSDAESRTPERTPFSLSALLDEVFRRFQAQATKAGNTLTADIASNLSIVGNKDQIEEVVVNLVDNAIKYTVSGGRVHMSTDCRENIIAVHVSDTGIGIPRKHLLRIFERFYRVDKARSRQSGGTGLGLSIVKHIIEAHGGQVHVESEPNQGSTFTFTLPALCGTDVVNGNGNGSHYVSQL